MITLTGKQLEPPLGEFVDCLWYAEGGGQEGSRERVLPSGSVDLVIDLGQNGLHVSSDEDDRTGQWYRGPVLFGTFSRFYVVGMPCRSAVVGVHFRPGGAAPFFALPICELADQSVLLEDVWGRDAKRLREQLAEAPTPRAMFGVIERALLARLADLPRGYRPAVLAIERIVEFPTGACLGDVVGDAGFSHKHFIHLFKKVVGMTPKTFYRIRRFRAVLDAAGEASWANVAIDCGYFDQSHLIRDFRAFAGVTPQEYSPAAPHRRDHVAIE